MKKTVFYDFYKNLENENVLYEDRKQIPFYTPFVEQKKYIDCSSTLYSIKAAFELLHANIADVHIFQNQQQTQPLFYL